MGIDIVLYDTLSDGVHHTQIGLGNQIAGIAAEELVPMLTRDDLVFCRHLICKA